MIAVIVRILRVIYKFTRNHALSERYEGKGELHLEKIVSAEHFTECKKELFSDRLQQYRSRVETTSAKKWPIFSYYGYCSVCGGKRNLYSDYRYSTEVNGLRMPNWREQLVCLHCTLNNRQRAAYHILRKEISALEGRSFYITEQYTPFYNILNNSLDAITGSEFLGDKIPSGKINSRGIRSENLCELSFLDEAFDVLLSYDVLEHIPDYKKALSECYRVLSADGVMMLSVPFNPHSIQNIVRAQVGEDGEVMHLLEPEYHGNPTTMSKCLCYYHFSWQLLDDLRESGFSDVYALMYWSKDYAYLGGVQTMIVARK